MSCLLVKHVRRCPQLFYFLAATFILLALLSWFAPNFLGPTNLFSCQLFIVKSDRAFLRPVDHAEANLSVFFSIKSSEQFHESRLRLLINTWIPIAVAATGTPVHVFTDGAQHWSKENQVLDIPSDGLRLVKTTCGSGHSRHDMCCKMAAELTFYLRFSHAHWFCHFDDDTYVHVRNLAQVLSQYEWWRAWYLGKPSLRRPIRIVEDGSEDVVDVWFATGGAGVCLSQRLIFEMESLIREGGFERTCSKIRLPDDCTLGYLVTNQLNRSLTVLPQLHSHLEMLSLLSPSQLHSVITLSYSVNQDGARNTVHLAVPILGRQSATDSFSLTGDPTRLFSAHCLFYPQSTICRRFLAH